MISTIISRLVILVFGTLYPAYASYKAVRTKNVKEYVKWMMYWIVFALFTCAETFTDILLSWFPFYYEVKILLVLWLLSPATKGSSILYRKFVHPALCRREQEIDEYIAKAKDQGYRTVLNLGTRGVNYGMNVIMQTAMKGGGGLVQQLRKSYSLSDLSVSDDQMDAKYETDEVREIVNIRDPRILRRSISDRNRNPRSSSVDSSKMDMCFPEMDVGANGRSMVARNRYSIGHIRSSEDISSSYIPENDIQDSLTHAVSGNGARNRMTKSSFTSIKRPTPAEESEFIIKELDEDNIKTFLNEPSDSTSNVNNILPAQELLIQQMAMLMMKELCSDDPKNDKEERFSRLMNILGNTSKEAGSCEETTPPSPKSENEQNNLSNIENSITSSISSDKAKDSLQTVDKIIENPIKTTIASEDSDDEMSAGEFNTPKGSPLLENKKRKNKKRQAPIPPKTGDVGGSKLSVDSKNEIQLSSENISKVNQRDNKSPMRKLQGKSTESINKLLNLSSKLTFWNKANDGKKSINEPNKKDDTSSIDSIENIKTTSNATSNSDSDDDRFEDAPEINLQFKNLDSENVTYIPLRLESLLVNMSSKSTDV